MAENKYDVGFNKFKNIYGELGIRGTPKCEANLS